MDTRVGYASISIIRDLLDDLVRSQIRDNQYIGDPKYIIFLDRFNKILDGQYSRSEMDI